MSSLEATAGDGRVHRAARRTTRSRAAYARAHERYLADRESIDVVPEIAGISAGGMPERVKCLHALAGHALAAGPGVNPIGDLALERSSWSPDGVRVPDYGVDDAAATASARDGAAPRACATCSRGARGRRGVVAAAALGSRRAPPAHADAVRDREYWLDDYGIRRGLGRPRRAPASPSPSSTPASTAACAELAGRSSAARTSPGSASPTARPRSATDEPARHDGRLARSPDAARAAGSGVIGVAPEADLLAHLGRVRPTRRRPSQRRPDRRRGALGGRQRRRRHQHVADAQHARLAARAGTTRSSTPFEHDVVVVAAAGNRGSGTDRGRRSGDDPGVLTVAGVDRDGERELRRVSAGHHDRRRRAERGARRRRARRRLRAVGRHERRGADRRRASSRSCAPRIRSSTPPTSSTGSSRPPTPRASRCRARSTATASIDAGRRASPPRCRRSTAEPDGRPRRVDHAAPARRRRPPARPTPSAAGAVADRRPGRCREPDSRADAAADACTAALRQRAAARCVAGIWYR